MKCKNCNKSKEEHQLVQYIDPKKIKSHCVINKQVMLGFEFEEEKFPKIYEMGLGYKIKLEKNGWIEYSQGDKKLTLVNCKKDIDILEKILLKSKELFK